MKHIILVTTSYPVLNDGSEAAGSFVADFAEVLSQTVKVTVIAPSYSFTRVVINRNLSVNYFAVPGLPLSLLKPYNPLNWLPILKILINGYIEIERVIRNYRADHIFALWALPSGFWAYLASIRFSIPYSIWSLGSDIWELGSIPVVKSFLKKILKNSRANFADGHDLRRRVEIISQKQCFFLPSTREFPIALNKKLAVKPPYKLAFIGRWHPNKGVDLLLDSLECLKEDNWKNISEIVVAGGGPLNEMVKTKAGRLVEHDYPVVLKGFIDKSEAAALLAGSDYLLIPSRIESIPVVFSDAMKSYTPVIANPVGDLELLIKKFKVGITSEEVSAKSFAEAIIKASETAPDSFINGLNKAYKAFDINKIVDTFIRIIKQG